MVINRSNIPVPEEVYNPHAGGQAFGNAFYQSLVGEINAAKARKLKEQEQAYGLLKEMSGNKYYDTTGIDWKNALKDPGSELAKVKRVENPEDNKFIMVTPSAENISHFGKYAPGFQWTVGQPTSVPTSIYAKLQTGIQGDERNVLRKKQIEAAQTRVAKDDRIIQLKRVHDAALASSKSATTPEQMEIHSREAADALQRMKELGAQIMGVEGLPEYEVQEIIQQPTFWQNIIRQPGTPVKQVVPVAPATPKELSAEDNQALDWAKKNPGDPRAKAIRKKLGR